MSHVKLEKLLLLVVLLEADEASKAQGLLEVGILGLQSSLLDAPLDEARTSPLFAEQEVAL